MANPFLSMSDPIAPTQQESFNPFMMDSSEPVIPLGENPFAVSNPFSDFGSMEPAIADTVPHDIFGKLDSSSSNSQNIFESGTDLVNNEQYFLVKPTQLNLTSDSEVENLFDIQTDESMKPKRPPPPSRPLPPETQNLILTVTGQMDYTSSEMLGRIPPTRTPSPISAMDLHSPGTTPEPPVDMFFDHEDKEPFEVSKSSNIMMQNTTITALATSVNQNQNNSKPARPPPRPQPPPIPPAPKVHAKMKNNEDDINLFDAATPPTIKPTKEAILSLYAKKEEDKPVDFLSDDLHESSLTIKESSIKNDQCNISVNQKSQDITMSNNEKENSQPSAEVQSPSLVTSRKTSLADESNNPFENVNVSQNENLFNSSEVMTHPEENIFSNGVSKKNSEMITENVFAASETPFSNISSEVISEETTQESPFPHEVPYNTPFDTDPNKYENKSLESASYVHNQAEETPFGTSGTLFATTETAFTSNDPSFSTNETPFSINDQATAPTSFDNHPSNIFETKTETFMDTHTSAPVTSDAFATVDNAFAQPQSQHLPSFGQNEDAFDAFSAKFDSTISNNAISGSAWGDQGTTVNKDIAVDGFGAEAFDEFLSMDAPPAPAVTPAHMSKQESQESDDDNFNFTIRPKAQDGSSAGVGRVPALAPPPRPQALPESPRINPFAEEEGIPQAMDTTYHAEPDRKQSGSETPPTPLFDDDVSQPLEDFPRTTYTGPGWEMQLRQPNKKKITGQRFWKKIFVKLAYQGDNPVVQLYNTPNDKEPFQELPLQACYSVSEISAQQYDQFGKIFTVKLQYIFYKERPGVRPGQVTKAERITNKLSQFAAYAIQGDYQGVKEFGSDLKKLGLPVEHAPQISQLFKIGSLNFEDVKQFSVCVEEALFKLAAHRDRALTYKMEEVQITAVDELYVEQDAEGSVLKQIARVRLFFLGFLSGMPDIELGVNDLRRQGKEVVGRHDIIPVVTEEWIRVENTEFHACVQPEDFAATQIIKFKPPDACYIELMRFRIRPPKNRELPLQLKAVWCVNGNKVELRADVLVPGFASRKLGQIPCEDVMIRFPIPESWIYLFRVEKHFRYGSVKSAHRRTGKIKGIERFLGAVDTLQESLIEVTSGQAKYEHQHRAIVWRMPRLPKEGQGAYTTHNMVCRMALTSYDQIPAELAKWAYVEFTMPATQVSHMTVRSVSLVNHDSDDPPEKYVRYLARHEYIVGIEYTTGTSTAAYVAAASVPAAASKPEPAPAVPEPHPASSSDSD